MFAVIKTGGKQYKVSAGDKIKIEKLDADKDKEVVFDEVLLVGGKEVKIGQPLVKGVKVKAKILKQAKAKKVIVFKYKAKKRYQVKRGHRQPYTEVEITSVVLAKSGGQKTGLSGQAR